MVAMGWDEGAFSLADELTETEQSLSFCHDHVEAIFYSATHPSSRIRRVLKLCNAAPVPVSGANIERLVSGTPYLSHTQIPGGVYEGVPEPVQSFGTTVTVATSTDVDDELVRALVATVFENTGTLEAIYPVLHELEPANMLGRGLVAPLHPAVERYVREKGLSSLVSPQ